MQPEPALRAPLVGNVTRAPPAVVPSAYHAWQPAARLTSTYQVELRVGVPSSLASAVHCPSTTAHNVRGAPPASAQVAQKRALPGPGRGGFTAAEAMAGMTSPFCRPLSLTSKVE